MNVRDYPVAIIGGGPVGMAAAAHLTERNIPFLLFESGKSAGASLSDWGHVQTFSPWRYNIDKAAERLLQDMNWQKPDEEGLPSGSEMVKEYLLPLSFHPRIAPGIHFSARVISVSRKGFNKVRTMGREGVPFILKVQEGEVLNTYEASAIIDASGTWNSPNPFGAGGMLASGEPENSDRIAYRIPDITGKDLGRYAGKTVMVIGGGHSAVNSLLELAELKEKHPKTRLHWGLITENLSTIYGGKEEDALKARGALGIKIEKLVNSGALVIHTPYFIHEISRQEDSLTVKGFIDDKYHEISGVEEIIANTGARPDLSIFRELRVQVDPALESVPELAGLIDPNIHSCGTIRPHGERELRQPEPNFYVAGVKSYGRAPTFLMATGYEQVRSIVAYLDGDLEAAERVELDLPETGVCSSDNGSGIVCCGTTPALSEEEKEEPAGAACCPPATNKQTNVNIMEKEEKVTEEQVAASSCCGGAPTANADACCKLDEEKKEEGEAGCGCNTAASSPAKPVKAASCC